MKASDVFLNCGILRIECMFSECTGTGASRLMGQVCSEQKKKFLIMKIILLTLHCLITTIFISSCIIMKGISMSFRGLKSRERAILSQVLEYSIQDRRPSNGNTLTPPSGYQVQGWMRCSPD